MAAIVVPFRGAAAKRRLSALPPETRSALALAMLADVLTACVATAPTTVVTEDERAAGVALLCGASVVDEVAARGQGAAVALGLTHAAAAPVLVVNADLPCVTRADVEELLTAVPRRGIAVAPASDGTTNALGLSSPQLFAPLYGPRSADRFRSQAGARIVANENLADDVDTLADLERIESRAGRHTRAALAQRVGTTA